MVRHTFINNQVLQIFDKLPSISFPLDMLEIIEHFPKCRFMTYEQFAIINNCSINDVIDICESNSGCTHYDVLQDRYLILCNQNEANGNAGRKRWTFGHELGHIVCKHHVISAYEKLSENNLINHSNPEYEAEADYFAATLLSPFPLFRILNIRSSTDVQNIFGLSCEASKYRYNQYLQWLKTKRKTSWENDLVRMYLRKKENNN